ncbi:MAG: class I SAM-dependent methyltransferase [Patulibacter minatonensis]
MAHAHDLDPSTTAAEWWQDRYATGATTWSGNPNGLLVEVAEELAPESGSRRSGDAASTGELGAGPRTALDLGCGTGGDAIWLASLGWRVTAVDIAQAALDQGAQHAAEVSAEVADRITWERHDFEVSFPAGQFDLVSACYLQSPVEFARLDALRAAAAAVAPGGALIVVSHESFPSGDQRDPGSTNYMPLVDELVADLALPEAEWTVHTARSVPRRKTTADGREIAYADHVARFDRRS